MKKNVWIFSARLVLGRPTIRQVRERNNEILEANQCPRSEAVCAPLGLRRICLRVIVFEP
jgi:hypothetical protein